MGVSCSLSLHLEGAMPFNNAKINNMCGVLRQKHESYMLAREKSKPLGLTLTMPFAKSCRSYYASSSVVGQDKLAKTLA